MQRSFVGLDGKAILFNVRGRVIAKNIELGTGAYLTKKLSRMGLKIVAF